MPISMTFHVRVKGDSSVGIPDSEETVSVKLEHGLDDAELESELEQALKATLLPFFDTPCTIMTEKENAAFEEKMRAGEERAARIEAELEKEITEAEADRE